MPDGNLRELHVLQLAMFAQRRDAREWGVVLDDGVHPTWEETDDMFGKPSYLKDAEVMLSAVEALGYRYPEPKEQRQP